MAEGASTRTRVLLVDGHGLAFRAYHALPEMINSKGQPIRVAYGYTSMLLLALSQGFDCAVAAFDPPGRTFRDEKMATYKAQRKPTPQELIDQIPLCEQLTSALNIPVVVVPGFEADDVLGTLSKQASEAGCETVIVTGDMDLIQLVDENTSLQSSRRGSSEPVLYDPAAVRARYGFAPRQMIDFKALRGDASDNIPGVPGIGEKTATALIQQYGDLDRVLAAVGDMPSGRTRTNLEAHLDEALFGREMVTIVRDVPGVGLDLAACRVKDYDQHAAIALLGELGMPSLIRRLPAFATVAEEPQLFPAESVTPQILDRSSIGPALEEIRTAGIPVTIRLAADPPLRSGRILGVALALDAQRCWYLPLSASGQDPQPGGALEPLLRLLADPDVPKAAYQWKDELLALMGAGWAITDGDFDCVLAAYLADSRGRTPALAALSREFGGPSVPDPEAYLGRGQQRLTPLQLDDSARAALFGGEAAAAAAIRPALEARLEEVAGSSLLRDMEIPVTRLLAEMERLGVRLDAEQLRTLSVEMRVQVLALEEEMFRLAGRAFSPGSPQQLATLLYDDLGLQSSRRTKTGRSTDAQALEALREEHPIVPLVLEWRQVTKLRSTYVDALPALVDPQDGRVHTSFNQAVAATGRLSSSDPNLQNIPIRSELGRRIRAAFVPGEHGWQMVSADYSQIELRVLAHLSQDPQLLAAFTRGDDIHADTAAQVFSVDRAAVTAEQRRMAKVVNFGILYGLSSFGLARDLGIPAAVAEEFIRRYFDTFSGVRGYLNYVRQEARSNGYVTTLLGRRRYLTDIHSSSRQLREASERMAINMPIQGSAADLMKLGMIQTAAALKTAGLSARMLLQVHDELVFEAPPGEVDAVGQVAREGMGGIRQLSVPLVVDLKSGPNWRDLSPFTPRSR
ncbi:MAG TPA: DNA polymerase I [Candidatus Dormibacteraeota bacterium]|nr:DNA polymerase I [Candidatus Dormibacteraeota bacterium]